MAQHQIPTIRQRRLGAELRRLREEHGLTMQAAARRLHRSTSSLSRIESAGRGLRYEFLLLVFEVYDVRDQALRESLFDLAKEDTNHGWWQRYGDVLSPSAADYIHLESDANTIRVYESLLIPGLLQVPEYARSLIETLQPALPPDQAERLVDARMRRTHTITRREPARYQAVIAEGALRQHVGGPQTMRMQLEHLLKMSELDHVAIQILPFTAGAHRGLLGPFEIMTIGGPADFSVAIFENPTGRLYVERDADVRRYAERLDQVVSAALPPTDSRALIARVSSEL